MAKVSALFNCSACGYRPPKWLGCCPECSAWGTISELDRTTIQKNSSSTASPIAITQLPCETISRMPSNYAEWDRVLGGGIVPGSFLLLTGDPGIGKSTLLLQVAHAIAEHHSVLYISTEESLQQLRQRAERLSCLHANLQCSDGAALETIIATVEQYKPPLVIIDSIQNCYSSNTQLIPGSIGQLREAAFKLMRLAKEHAIAIIVTGHITKDGLVAGPKLLEHMVDGVFYLQGEDRWQTRVLRCVKNRFGPFGELGFFQMDTKGLIEMPDINHYLLEDMSGNPGSTLISYSEGSRTLLLELQTLVIPTKFSMPQRIISGIEPKQVLLIAAIIEKYLHIKLSSHDIFFKVSGGFRIKDNTADLGIALSLLSSYFQETLPKHSVALGELSLTGHIKPINHIGMHIKEAQKFGLDHLLLAKNQKIEQKLSSTITKFESVYHLITLFDKENITTPSQD